MPLARMRSRVARRWAGLLPGLVLASVAAWGAAPVAGSCPGGPTLSVVAQERSTMTVPADFTITMNWQEGSLPPPHHYAYQLKLRADGQGEIHYTPGYAFQKPPTWRELWRVSPDEVRQFYQQLCAWQVFSRAWSRQPTHAVGGSLTSFHLGAAGQEVSIPSELGAADREVARQLAAAYRALVPEALWKDLARRRQAFAADQGQ